MKLLPANAAANSLTRYVREADANLLNLLQQPTRTFTRITDNSGSTATLFLFRGSSLPLLPRGTAPPRRKRRWPITEGLWVPDGLCVISGMSFRSRTNQSRLVVRCKGQENECHTHIREWIASLANRT